MIDAEEIANAVNLQSEDEVSARMVREYVRLGILDKALHPGRKGFGASAIDQMLQARRMVHAGAGLKEVRKQMLAGGQREGRVETKGRSGQRVFWVSLGEVGRVGLMLPKAMSPAMAEEVVSVSEKALSNWANKNQVRINQND